MAHHIEPDSVTTFMHQMIPHHQNAVNMARVLLKKTPSGYVGGDGSLKVNLAETEAGEHDGFQDILLDMINTQNYQISEMRKWLLEHGKKLNSTCARRLTPQEAPGVPSGFKRLQTTSPEAKLPSASARKLAAHANTWKFKMNLFVGETGYYEVEGYTGVQPELTMELNKEYIIDQTHITNWMHPVGLAFQPDGAHDVLYPGSNGEGAPEMADGPGTKGYTYIYEIMKPGATAFEAATLDDYEPLFFLPLNEWAKYKFQIKLKITDATVAKSIVYFCHIHNLMSGKIVITGGSGPEVKKLYTPTVPSAFDKDCGTDAAGDYAASNNKHAHCQGLKFVCGATENSFSKCMNAIDCKMNHEMQVLNIEKNHVATFMHQMIPHHKNAVNMARIMLKKTAAYGDGSLKGNGIVESEEGEHD